MIDALVSVIIPAKRRDKYLEALLAMLDEQTYRHIEVIVDDGPDGASASRNSGLKRARGEYVIFCDADDRVMPEYVEMLAEAISLQPDIVMAGCGYEVCTRNAEGESGIEQHDNTRGSKQEADVIKTCAHEQKLQTTEEMLFRLFDTRIYQGYIWNKIFRKELIEKFGLCFSQDVRYNEDRLFIFEYLLRNPGRVAFSDKIGYKYMLSDDSVMGEIRSRAEVADEMTTEFLAFERMISQLEELSAYTPGSGISDAKGNGISDIHGDATAASVRARLIDAIRQDEIQSELRLFKRMVGKKDIFKYRRSAMRRYAKACPAKLYVPRGPMEDVLLRIYKRYAWSGCTYTGHPEYFEGVGYMGDLE